MRATDAWAISERGVPSLELMEAAGLALAEAAQAAAAPGPIRIVCGKGNNGGDGLVAARLLAGWGHEVEVLLLWPAGELSGDAAANLERLDRPFRELGGDDAAAALDGSGAVVDAIFGTGFEGSPRDPAAAAIEAINGCGAPVVAADIASGVDASTGEVAGAAVEAAITVSFHAAKLGHWIAPGQAPYRRRCGWRRSGSRDGAPAEAPGGLIRPSVLELLARRGADSTKFSSGQVLVVGGSRGLTGAVCMSSRAATRAGAGYATVAVPAELEAIFEIKLTEVMSVGCPSADGHLDPRRRRADPRGGRARGRGRPRTRSRSRRGELRAGRARSRRGSRRRWCSTPTGSTRSPGGSSCSPRARRRPCSPRTPASSVGCSASAPTRSEPGASRRATEAAERAGAIVVLKGDDTIVAAPGERAIVNGLASPALATAGTGDVLSGMIAALIARGLEARTAVAAAVHAHTRAGRAAAAAIGAAGVGDRRRRDRGDPGGDHPGGRRGVRAEAVIDPGAVERNCRRLASELSAGTELCAVVKADGYGHGAVPCAAAALAGGATWLAVAAAAEAAELRAELGERARLLVLGALTPRELDLALAAGADVAVWRRGFLELAEARGRELGIRPQVHVKYDTGMGRLGERDPELVAGLARSAAASPDVDLAGIWTHFATADEPDARFFDLQLERFRELALPLRDELGGPILHAANSAATLREPGSHLDMVRCGVAIYGLDPFGSDPAEQGLEPALELRSYVADVKRFEPGDSAGYGRTWTASEPTWVGVLPIGYGDGVRRALSNNAEVLVGGRRHPLVGTVSMDNLTVDLGPEPLVEAGRGGDPDRRRQGGERILARSSLGGWGRSTTRSPAGSHRRVPRELAGAR